MRILFVSSNIHKSTKAPYMCSLNSANDPSPHNDFAIDEHIKELSSQWTNGANLDWTGRGRMATF